MNTTERVNEMADRMAAAGGVGLGHNRADHVLPENLLLAIAEELLRVFVEEGDAAVDVAAHDDAVGVLHEFAILQLAFAQGLLGLLAVGDILGDGDHAGVAAARVLELRDVPHVGAVAAGG